jgi:hypothetical protein
MRTSFITAFALFASTLAMPATKVVRQAGLCSSGSATPLCCDVDVLGVADLDCETRKFFSTSYPTPRTNILT